jgi:galactose mutarotase-like enzyme
MVEIWNDKLSVTIAKAGAELQHVKHNENGLEYMWSGDPGYWSKHSPILFPIVGALKNNEYLFGGKPYQLGRHGFAREREFQVYEHGETSVSFRLDSDEETFKVYPFEFQLILNYVLHENELSVEYLVINKGAGDMLFSVGGHPAFKVPLANDLAYDDYYLEFAESENSPRWPIAAGGLIQTSAEPFPYNGKRIDLTKDLFAKDAIVFKDLKSTTVSLKSDKSSNGLEFDYTGFPFLGIWAAPQADFVCIEPWCGIADSTDTTQNLPEKEGINRLAEGESFSRTWKVKFF